MSLKRSLNKSAGAAVLAVIAGLAVLSCAETTSPGGGGGGADQTPPTVSITRVPADSVIDVNQGLQITVTAADNLALANLNVTVTGVAVITFDTTFTTVVQSFSTVLNPTIASGTTGGQVTIVATARDGSGNVAEARDSVAVTDEIAPTQQITSLNNVTSPTPGDTLNVPAGDTLRVGVKFSDPSGVATYGAAILGPDSIGNTIAIVGDTVDISAAPLIDVTDTLLLAIPTDMVPGTYDMRTFATDNVGNTDARTADSALINVVDAVAPTIAFVLPDTNALVRIGDTVRVQVQVTDNKGVVSVVLDGVAHRGDRQLGTDTVLTKLDQKTVTLDQDPDTLVIRDLIPTDPTDPTSETVYIRATAADSTGNVSIDSLPVSFVSGPSLELTNPPDSSLVSPGKQMTIIIRGQAPTGVSKVGYFVTGAYTNTDTSRVIPAANPQVRDTTISFTETVPSGAPLGFITVTPFGRDSLGNVGTGDPITVEIVADAGASDVTPPLVKHVVEGRIETDDSITIVAQDAGGISNIAFTVTDLATGNVVSTGSVALPGVATSVTQVFPLGLDTLTVDTLARLVTVTATAVDANGLTGLLSPDQTPVPSTGTALLDTLTVVAGRTLQLPFGGRIAEALYNSNRDEIYFSNVDRDRIEVFDVGTQTFQPAIPVGSRPWGMDMYPADTLGSTLDTLVVANSGGTNFSIVDLTAQREFRRHQVPIFVAEKVSISIEDGVVRVDIVDFNFSDRPQSVGVVCRVTTGTSNCAADSILAVFSTSPSIDQNTNPLRGTLRWENISSGQDLLAPSARDGHLFYEHAQGVAGLTLDTLQVLAGYGDTVITKLGGAVGVMTNIASIPFMDTTFVRSSGNHARVMVGEGGTGEPIAGFARAMRYNINRTFTKTSGVPVVIGGVNFSANFQTDAGVSATINVSDFISNTAIGIRSVATNFNGLTNAVRSDSVYILDENLRLAGIVPASGSNAGMDMPFNHNFDATPAGAFPPASFPSNRIIYTARDDANIDVFDTRHFGRVAQIPVRDPVTGPVTIAQLPAGEQFLIAVTDAGVVVVTLPTLANPFPVRGF